MPETCAAACGLSVSTVSKALNGYSDVSEKTREQVRLAATAYNHGTLWRSPGTGSLDRIRAVTAEEKFPLPNLFRTRMRYYSYGDLAARYYAQVFNQ